MDFNIDVIIFIIFLAVNLVVGLSHGKRVKTIKDYALGGQNFSTAALVATIVATVISGSGFFIILSNTYSDGLYYLIPSISMSFTLIITGYFLVPRMGEFLGCTSVAEAMGRLYGKEIRLITAICGILWTIGGIAVQFKVFGNVFNYFLGIDAVYSVFLASAIVIIYSSFGGIKAVTYTDILQFITFGFVIPLIGIFIWNHVYDLGLSFSKTLQTPQFNYKEVFNLGNPRFWEMIPLFLYFAVPTTDPTCFQRIAMGRSVEQVKKAWLISAILIALVKLAAGWIPFLVKVINPNLQTGQIINYVADNYAFTGLKGLIIIGIAAMAMSTADSRINAAAVLFANDIKKMMNIKANELLLSKLFSLVLGIVAIFLALSKSDLLGIVMTSASLYMATITVPLLFAIFGFRSTKKTVLIGITAGFVTVIGLNIFSIKTDVIIVIAMLTNLIFFIGSHYLLEQSGGWVGVIDTRYLDEIKRKKIRTRAKRLAAIKNFNLIEFCKKNSPKDELTYMWLGIYFILYSFTTMYSTQVELLKDTGKIILTIYQIMMVTGVLMAMYPIWPARIKHEIIMQVAWHIVIFYMLILFSCFFVMVSNFGQLQFGVFILNMLISAVLTGWRIGFGMAAVGFYLSFEFYKYYADLDTIDTSIGSPQFIFVYALMFAGSVLLIFFKPKQEYQALTEEKNEHLSGRIGVQEEQTRKALGLKEEFIRNIQHEYHAPMVGISSMADSLLAAYDHLSDKERLKAIEHILKSSTRLEVFDANISTLYNLSKGSNKLEPEPEDINFSDLVYNCIETCRRLYENNKEDREFVLNIEENIIVSGNRYYLTQVVDNLMINAISYCQKGKITIILKQGKDEEEKDIVTFTIIDEGLGIPQDELLSIFDEFVVSSRTHTHAGGRGVGLALAKRVIEVHGGRIKAESDGVKGSRFTFALPLKHLF